MDDGYSGIHMLTLIVLVVLEAVLYGFGAALQELGGGLEEEARDGNRKAEKILALAERPGRLVSTNLVFTTGSSLIVGAFIFRKMIWSSQNPVYAVVEALVYIILLVSLGMALPKRLAAENPEKWAMGLFPAVSVLMTLLIPVTAAVGAVSSLLLRAAGMDPSSQEEGVTEEDIMSMVNEGHEQGVLEASEAEMITNIFELGDKRAEHVMTHRKNLVLLDGSMTLKEAVRFILEEGNHSRFPVYGDNTDDILGVVHLRDVMVWAEKKACENIPIREIPDLMMEAKFIPESRSVDSLFREMQSQKIHMAIVVDEYGQLSGIVTMEDILEEIVGNIQDEYDREEELIRPLGNGAFLISGMASLEDVSEALGIQFTEEEEEDYDTLSGLLISLLDRIPGEDERPVIPCGGYDFQVERVEHKRIASVRAVPRPGRTDPAHKEQSDTCQPEKMVVE